MDYFLAVANRILEIWKTGLRWIALIVFLISFFGFFVAMFSNGSPWHWLICAIALPFWILVIAYVPYYAVRFALLSPLQEVYNKRNTAG